MNENQKYKILALFGESGCGKDTIQNWIVSNIPNTHKIISCTTRPPREKEINGKDYYFIGLNEFVPHEFIEYTKFNTWFYGTRYSELDENKINIGVFNIEGIKSLTTNSTINVLPVRIKCDDKVRLIRALTREKNPDCYEICRRFLSDKEDFANISFGWWNAVTYDNNPANNDDWFGICNISEIKQFMDISN